MKLLVAISSREGLYPHNNNFMYTYTVFIYIIAGADLEMKKWRGLEKKFTSSTYIYKSIDIEFKFL